MSKETWASACSCHNLNLPPHHSLHLGLPAQPAAPPRGIHHANSMRSRPTVMSCPIIHTAEAPSLAFRESPAWPRTSPERERDCPTGWGSGGTRFGSSQDISKKTLSTHALSGSHYRTVTCWGRQVNTIYSSFPCNHYVMVTGLWLLPLVHPTSLLRIGFLTNSHW